MNDEDRKYLKRAIELAKESVNQDGFPAGALVVKDGKIISEGISIGNLLNDPTSHAETSSIRQACKKLKTPNLAGATLYESIECCAMCFSVAYWSGISKIVYACRKTPEMVSKFYYEGNINNQKLNNESNRRIELVFIPDFEKESLAAVEDWEKNLL